MNVSASSAVSAPSPAAIDATSSAQPKAADANSAATPASVNPPSTVVTISSAALAAQAANAEAMETPTQTAQEARGNDHQAQRLLAKEASEKAAG